MIIRRRTYIRLFTGRYGYFMRNSTWNENAWYSSDTQNASDALLIQRLFVYSKCMQQEAPIGEFPKEYRNNDMVNMNATATGFSAVGYTDGTTIIVATMKRLFRSTNGGLSWTKLADLPLHDYYNVYCNPMVYMYTDSNSVPWYCVLYSYKASATYTGNYIYLMIYRYNANTGQGTETLVLYDYANYLTTSSGQEHADECHANYYGTFYAYAISNKGLVCFVRRRFLGYLEGSGNDYDDYFVYDFINLHYSSSLRLYKSGNPGISSYMEYTGLWINTDNGYGKFLVLAALSWLLDVKKLITSAAITYNGYSLSMADAPTSITTGLPNFDTLWPENAAIFMGFTKKYTNKLFFYASQSSGEGCFYVCDRNLGNVVKISNFTDEMLLFFGESYTWPCGCYISPDGNWGVYLCEKGNLVFDLTTNLYWGGNNLGTMEGYQTAVIRAQLGGYMLPETTIA